MAETEICPWDSCGEIVHSSLQSLYAMKKILPFLIVLFTASCSSKQEFDIIIKDGVVYDGLGGVPVIKDIGVRADTIAFIGDLSAAGGKKIIDANGLAV